MLEYGMRESDCCEWSSLRTGTCCDWSHPGSDCDGRRFRSLRKRDRERRVVSIQNATWDDEAQTGLYRRRAFEQRL